MSVLNVDDGSLRSLPVNAYLLSGDGGGRLAFATTARLGVAEGENVFTLVSRTELDRCIGAPPGYATPPGEPEDYFRDPDIMRKWWESYISVVESLSWSPKGDRLAALVQAHSLASLVVVRSAVLVVDRSGGAPPQVLVTRDAAEGKIRWVGWLDNDTLVVFHNDYLEPECDEGWAFDPPDPSPTASFAAVHLSGSTNPRVLLRVPWYSRVVASGPGGLVAVVQQPRGPRVDPEGAVLKLLEGKIVAHVSEDLVPVTVPDGEGRYLAVRHRPFGQEAAVHELVVVRGRKVHVLTEVETGPYLRQGWVCSMSGGTAAAGIGAENVKVWWW